MKPQQRPLPPMDLVGKLLLVACGLSAGARAQETGSCEAGGAGCVRVVGLIPARAQSKGIRGKNLSVVGNETLVSRTVRIAHEVGKFDSVWVSTDGEKIAEEGVKRGAKIHWRDAETATDTASTLSAVEDFLLRQPGYDIVAVLQCTSPFLQARYLREGLNVMTTTDADCVFSVSESFQLRWTTSEDGFARPLNFDSKNRPRRQDWDGELVENGMFYIAKTEMVLRDKVLQNDRCGVVKIPKRFSLEIDTEDDLKLATVLLPLLENHER